MLMCLLMTVPFVQSESGRGVVQHISFVGMQLSDALCCGRKASGLASWQRLYSQMHWAKAVPVHITMQTQTVGVYKLCCLHQVLSAVASQATD